MIKGVNCCIKFHIGFGDLNSGPYSYGTRAFIH